MAANINDLLEDPKDIAIRIFKDTTSKFLEKLEANQEHQQFIGLIKLQIAEVISLLKMDDIEIAGHSASGNSSHESTACTSNTLKTPKSSTLRIDLSKIKKFSPLIVDGNRIRCSVSWCKSRFSYKRTYNKHMVNFHPNVLVDHTVKDPPGTCELLTAGLPCHTTLCERAMMYHLEHIHGIHVPANHFLYGFDTSLNVPSAIFVPDAHRYQAKKSSTLNIPNVIVVSQNTRKHQKRPYPTISPLDDFQSVNEEPIDSTPKAPKPKKVRRALYIKSPSESSRDTTYHQLEHSSPIICTPEAVLQDGIDDGENSQLLLTPDNDKEIGNDNVTPQSNSCSIHDDVNEDINENNSMTQPVQSELNEKSDSSPTQELSPERSKRKSTSTSSSSDDSSGSSSDSSDESSDSKDSTDSDRESVNDRGASFLKNSHGDNGDDQETEVCTNVSLSDDDDVLSQIIKDSNDDSDIEFGDSDLYTAIRRRNREERYNKRNVTFTPLYERDENRIFIQDFKYFLLNLSVQKQPTSTVTGACNHLFIQDDSLLSHEFKNNSEFTLEHFRKFNSNNFIHIKYPGDWINETAGENGNKGLSRLKGHSYLREFIEYEADKFDSSSDFCATKQSVRDNLNGIKQQVTNTKLFRKYNILSNTKEQRRKNVKMILHKSVDFKKIIKTWNTSVEKEELDKDYEFMFNNCIEKGTVSIKQLTQYSQYARIVLLMSDKNRGGVYQFKCIDFVNRHPCYFPDGYEGFSSLPLGWKPLDRPSHNPTPSTWMICLPGNSVMSTQLLISHNNPYYQPPNCESDA